MVHFFFTKEFVRLTNVPAVHTALASCLSSALWFGEELQKLPSHPLLVLLLLCYLSRMALSNTLWFGEELQKLPSQSAAAAVLLEQDGPIQHPVVR